MRWRWRGRVAGAVIGAGLLVSAVTGCGLSGSGDDLGRLQDGIDELTSVRGPEGQEPTSVEVRGCDDDAEVPLGIGLFDHGTSLDGGAEALNAERDVLSDWYLPRWKDLGWDVDPEVGSATKTFDGKRLTASIDGLTDSTYTVIVVRDGAGLCS